MLRLPMPSNSSFVCGPDAAASARTWHVTSFEYDCGEWGFMLRCKTEEGAEIDIGDIEGHRQVDVREPGGADRQYTNDLADPVIGEFMAAYRSECEKRGIDSRTK